MYNALHHKESLDEYYHSCGMRDLSTDCDDDWVLEVNQCNQFQYTHVWIKHLPAPCLYNHADFCNWWYHLQCINKKMIGKYSMEDVESLEFGLCSSANGQFNFN